MIFLGVLFGYFLAFQARFLEFFSLIELQSLFVPILGYLTFVLGACLNIKSKVVVKSLLILSGAMFVVIVLNFEQFLKMGLDNFTFLIPVFFSFGLFQFCFGQYQSQLFLEARRFVLFHVFSLLGVFIFVLLKSVVIIHVFLIATLIFFLFIKQKSDNSLVKFQFRLESVKIGFLITGLNFALLLLFKYYYSPFREEVFLILFLQLSSIPIGLLLKKKTKDSFLLYLGLFLLLFWAISGKLISLAQPMVVMMTIGILFVCFCFSHAFLFTSNHKSHFSNICIGSLISYLVFGLVDYYVGPIGLEKGTAFHHKGSLISKSLNEGPSRLKYNGYLASKYPPYDFFRGRVLVEELETKQKVLIFGAGNHIALSYLLAFTNSEVTIIDRFSVFKSQAYLDHLYEIYPVLKKENGRVKYLFGDAWNLISHLPSLEYDHVYWNLTWPHFAPSQKLFTEYFVEGIHRVLKRDGLFHRPLWGLSFFDKGLFEYCFKPYRFAGKGSEPTGLLVSSKRNYCDEFQYYRLRDIYFYGFPRLKDFPFDLSHATELDNWEVSFYGKDRVSLHFSNVSDDISSLKKGPVIFSEKFKNSFINDLKDRFPRVQLESN